MWKQLKSFSQAKGGKVPGYCLRNVRLGYTVPEKYNSAWECWLKSPQHAEAIPTGIDVPVYFWYKDFQNGHIGVRLANGTFWSDGNIYASIAAYEAVKAPRYRGWSTKVNDVAVIEFVPDPPKPVAPMPPVGSKVQFIPQDARTTFKAGTTAKAGTIYVKDNTFIYTVRGYDPAYKHRILINSAQAGGNGVAVALYYTNGTRVPGWKQL